MKYLILGSEGFIGKALYEYLRNEEPSATIIKVDRIIPNVSDEKCRVYKSKIEETDKIINILEKENPKVVFNLAGKFNFTSKEELFRINCFSPIELLEKSIEKKYKMILIGSAAEYGIAENKKKIKENVRLQPISDYGLSKVCQTFMALRFAANQKYPAVIIARLFNVIGAGVSRQLFLGDFASQIARIEKGLQPATINVGNLNSYRDLLPVTRVAEYLYVLSKKGEPGSVYNICSAKPQKIGHILKKLLSFSACKINISINKQKIKINDISWSVGDNSKILKLHGYSVLDQELAASIKDALDYYRGNT